MISITNLTIRFTEANFKIQNKDNDCCLAICIFFDESSYTDKLYMRAISKDIKCEKSKTIKTMLNIVFNYQGHANIKQS